jgi:hypothetical protein
MLTTTRVRKADAGDEADLMELCRELHRENGLFSINEDRVRHFICRALSGQGGIIGVVGGRDNIEAALYLLISTHWYSDQWHLEELFAFVRPEYRKTNNAKDLICFAKRCSNEIGIPLVIGVVSNTRTEAKIRLYERQLAKPAGAFWVHQPVRAA